MNDLFPVKYAVLPIAHDLSFGYRRDFDKYLFYIVIKCFVTNRSTDYLFDGVREKYNVVPSYRFDLEENNIPDYRCGECFNSYVVDNVYDIFDEAASLRNRKNLILLKHRFLNTNEDIVLINNFKFGLELEDRLKGITKDLIVKKDDFITKNSSFNNVKTKIKKNM